jgi:resuscitation-promoting factor RpfA
MARVRGLCSALLATASLVVAAWAGPRPAAVGAALRDPQRWVDSVGADAAVVAVVGLLCWAALVWLGGALAVVACTALPGVLGRCADMLADRLVPAAVRRVATVLVGVSVTTGAAATGVAAAGDTAPRPPGAAAAAEVDWPHEQAIEHGSPPPGAGVAPVDWPHAQVTEYGSPPDTGAAPVDWPHAQVTEYGSPPDAGAAPDDWPHAQVTEYGSPPPGAGVAPVDRPQGRVIQHGPPPDAGAAPVDWPLATGPSGTADPTAGSGHTHAPSPSAASPVPSSRPPSSRSRPAEAPSGAESGGPRPTGQSTNETEPGSRPGGPARRSGRSAVADEHVVATGDSLWLIAARRLAATGADLDDAAIAAEWPRWYAVNADLIGPDPDLIHPGQRLVAPSASRSGHDSPTVPPGGP